MDSTGNAGTSPPGPGIAKRLARAWRLGLRWGLSGLPLGMLIGGGAGLWLAMIDNALYGIGGDNYSGPLSRTSGQEAWVYLTGLGLGATFGGGLMAMACGLMGCLWGIAQAKSANSARSEPELPQRTEPGAADRPRD